MIIIIIDSLEVRNKLMALHSVVTAVGERSPQYAADSFTNHLQSAESHGPEWNSSQTLQYGGAQDN